MDDLWRTGGSVAIEGGAGLLLREWADSDIPALVTLYDTAEMDRRTPVSSPFDVAAAKKYVSASHDRRAAGTSLQLAVTERGDEPVGEILVAQAKGNTYVELAYAISAPHSGQRLAQRSVLLVLDHLRAAGVALVRLSISEDNPASQHVARATGFHRTDLRPFERRRKGYTVILHAWERSL